MSLGSWEVKFSTSGMPEKIATAFTELNNLVGAEYNFIAYLGEQKVNGTNHAILAKQTIITGKDSENIVLVIFNEKSDGITLVSIDRVLESGGALGGIHINVNTEIPEDAIKLFNECFNEFTGAKVTPLIYLGDQVVKGMNCIFVAEVSAIAENAETKLSLVIVNSLTKEVSGRNLLVSNFTSQNLGYSFTWLKHSDKMFGAPLGEWP